MPVSVTNDKPKPSAATPTADKASKRLRSLDAMRGLVIALMLLVNMTWDREALPGQLFHVAWNDPSQGATVTDLVFPWFVFIAGAAIPLSVGSGRGRGKSSGEILRTAVIRGAKLYLLGVLLTVASFATQKPITWQCLFTWNILQLIGAAYVVATAVWLTPLPWRVGFVVTTLGLKWASFLLPWETVIRWATPRPLDGAPTGPGTWAHFDAVKQLLHMEHVSVATLWTQLVGWFGMAQQFAPLAAIAVIGGLLTERLVRAPEDQKAARARQIAVIGLLLVALGFVLQWDYRPEGGGLWGVATVPFSKWFFSPAYCLLAAGSGALLLVVMHAAIDLKGWLRAEPLCVLGKNALAIYLGAEMSFKLIFSKWLLPLPDGGADSIATATQAWIDWLSGSPAVGCLGWAVLWIGLWMAVAYAMDRRNVYWRV